MIRPTIAALTLALGGSLLVAAPAHAEARPAPCLTVVGNPSAHRGEVAGYRDVDPWLGSPSKRRPHKMLIGDSISRGNYRYLRQRPRKLEVTAVPGRDVGTLHCYIRDRLRSRSRLTHLVVALGTNGSEWWTYQDYKAVLDMVPPRTKVVFVTPYRTAASSPERYSVRQRASTSVTYTRWMGTIAGWSGRACLANWRAYAASRPWALSDGVHTTVAGARGWAMLINRAMKRCY